MKKKDKKQSKIKKIIIICICIIVLILSSCTVKHIINNVLVSDTHKVAQKIINEMKNNTKYKNSKIVDKGKDKEDEFSPKSISNIIDKRDNKELVIIYAYETNEEAEYYNNFITKKDELGHSLYDDSCLETLNDYGEFFDDVETVVIENYIFIIKDSKNSKSIKSAIEKIMSDYKNKSSKKIDSEKIETYYNNQFDKVTTEYNNIFDTNTNKVKEEILGYVNDIKKCSGNECKQLYDYVIKYEKYPELKEEIETVKDEYTEAIDSLGYACSDKTELIGAMSTHSTYNIYSENGVLTKIKFTSIMSCTNKNAIECYPITLQLNSCSYTSNTECVEEHDYGNRKTKTKITILSNGYGMNSTEETYYSPSDNIKIDDKVNDIKKQGYTCNIGERK